MGEVLSVQLKSSGFPGAPGYTTLCFSPIVVIPNEDKITAAHTFFDAMSVMFPPEWSGQIVGPCQVQDSATGTLLGVVPVPVALAAPIVGVDAAGYGAGVAGACVSWYTIPTGVGRPARGRTFLVPIAKGKYENDGTITAGGLSSMQGAAQALIDSGTGFGVWRRPKLGLGGVFFTAFQPRISDQAAFLSSRRS